ncbi:MAG: 1,4-dihydroxy-2-naphthoate octaprenyltransferase [Muribaculaceae bacterium]|nr:1,4-dihydroxy-2-naphthoate octaprenyltransferase [Muribaculaceae bacterium]
MIKAWIEAMRLRTLPVSGAGVIAGTACAIYDGGFNTLPFIICLLFALFAQIVSNFANEYFDFKKGLDRKGREGFRRGVTEGDISPKAMLSATVGLLCIDCLIGLSLIIWGGWWMLPVGIAIALFALGYSAGPYPLSHHGLGEIAVIIFFGIVPVCFTCYVQTGGWENFLSLSLPVGMAIGLMGANVLIVNNYRDAEEDRAVGKRTSVVIFGQRTMAGVYFFNGVIGCLLLVWVTIGRFNILWQAGTLLYLNCHYMLWQKIRRSEGKALNPLLGKTAMLMFALSIWLIAMMWIG